jgi:hypothetical protein
LAPAEPSPLYSQPAVAAPARLVADYSAEERSLLREAFSPIAANYRRHQQIAMCGVVGIVISVLVAILFRELGPWLVFPLALFWLFAACVMWSAPGLVCPGCRNPMNRGFGRYCPECGSEPLQPGNWFRPPRCITCGKCLRGAKRRRYKIRSCTHCGLMLDDAGV